MVACFVTSAPAAVIKGPYVLLENAAMLSLRLELDRPEATIVVRRGAAAAQTVEEKVVPDFRRTSRDTFVARVPVDLRPGSGRFLGYDVWHEGRQIGRYDWRSRIDGTLAEDPRLLVFGDTQGGKETTARLATRWQAEAFDLLIGLGDLVDAGSRYESWEEEFFGPLQRALPHHPLLVVPGNHDPYRERSMVWFDAFFARSDGRRYFAVDFGDLRLIGLNNSDAHTKYGLDPIDPLAPQYSFLCDALLSRAAQSRRVLVFAHVPLFSASTVVNREFGSELQRRYLLPLLERARVLGFFAGHHHKYERVLRAGLRGETQYVVTGGGGGHLFTVARETGGSKMDRQVFGVHHYVTVDLRGAGTIVARSVEGVELDRTTFGAGARMFEPREGLTFWPATLAGDFAVTPTRDARPSITLRPGALAAGTAPGRPGTELYRTAAGFVAVAHQLGGQATWQGYDPARRAWGYLQGAIMTTDGSGPRGSLAIVAVNGAELSPFDRIFPVLHWPVAGSRAGIAAESGAMLLLRGSTSFDLDPDPSRVLARWRWGESAPRDMATAQSARQLGALEGASPPAPLAGPAAAGILRLLHEASREVFLVRVGATGAIAATLVHWPGWRFLAIAPGDVVARPGAALFVPIEAETEVTGGIEQGVAGMWIRAENRSEWFVPLGREP